MCTTQHVCKVHAACVHVCVYVRRCQVRLPGTCKCQFNLCVDDLHMLVCASRLQLAHTKKFASALLQSYLTEVQQQQHSMHSGHSQQHNSNTQHAGHGASIRPKARAARVAASCEVRDACTIHNACLCALLGAQAMLAIFLARLDKKELVARLLGSSDELMGHTGLLWYTGRAVEQWTGAWFIVCAGVSVGCGKADRRCVTCQVHGRGPACISACGTPATGVRHTHTCRRTHKHACACIHNEASALSRSMLWLHDSVR